VPVAKQKSRNSLEASSNWFIDEATRIGKALKDGVIASDEADAKLQAMGALDLICPELMALTNDRA
jgi:hypothetical protein